ncbi:hypothetical protein C1H76_7067 [Elsinoe australis]|uniref:Velvet domain-containing protein n=1 Tax=Elsinoe australis TaxID=40998 RepID=A0A4U7AVF1_9PEZI|nr:hypothetical protein C1H76_7067 [Elsinoe australis]
MADMFRRTSSRKNGPSPVYRNGDDSPSKKSSSRSKSHSHRHHSESSSSSSSSKYGMAVMGQPPNLIPVGYTFQPSILITKRQSSSREHSSDSSRSGSFVAVVSLISSSSGAPLPNGVLRGQRLFSSVHDLPRDYRDRLPSDLKSTALGYVSFPNLAVTHPGSYQVKVALLRMPDSKSRSRDTDTLATIESQEFQVYNHPQYSA